MNDIKRDVWQPNPVVSSPDQPHEIIFAQGKFITCSKNGRVIISDWHGPEEVTAAAMFYLMLDTVEHLEKQLKEARRPWWRKALEKLT